MSLDNIRKQITDDVFVSEWLILKPHMERDAIFLVDPSLGIVEVGVALALDSKTQVQEWLANKKLRRIENSDVIDFECSPKLKFETAVVQPFVLIKIITVLN